MKKKKTRKLLRNPCRIQSVNDGAVNKVKHDFPFYPELAHLYSPDNVVLHQNAATIADTFQRGVETLKQLGHERAAKYLTFCLVPEWGDGPGEFSEQRIGGMPDLTRYIYGDKPIEQIWPRCGCCHEPMAFVGQFDLHPWLSPIHESFCHMSDTSIRQDDYAKFSAIGNIRMVQHGSLYEQTLWHLFVCPYSGQHWDQPSTDAVILISQRVYEKPSERQKCEPDAWIAQVSDFVKKHEKLRLIQTPGDTTEEVEGFQFEPRQIKGFKFRLQLDGYDCSDWRKLDALRDKMEKDHSDLFESHPSQFQLFGTPSSQQEAKRYVSPFTYGGIRPLTPFVKFNDDSADFTYMVYADTISGDGYRIYGKVDGSCT